MSAVPLPATAPIARSSSAPSRFGDRLLAARDRLLASPRFRRAATRFWPTRWIARRRARALFDVVAGFTYSQVLLACVRLGLFDLLLERPRTASEIAAHAALGDDATRRLLTAAVALRLVEHRHGGRYGVGALGAPMAGDAAIAAMVEHHAVLYADLADPVALLRARSRDRDESGTDGASALNRVWGYAAIDDVRGLDDRRVAAYSTLMTQSQPLVADQILDAYPQLGRHRRLLDVGGGEGAFAMAAAARHPGLHVTVFDLPAVAARARDRFAATGLGDRATAVGGDFACDALPPDADIATLVRVIHDHDDGRALQILRKVHTALPADGVLLLAEPMAGTAGAEPMGDAYFGFYLLAMGSGRARTHDELAAMLGDAGFERIRSLRTALPIQARVLMARKSAVS